MRFTKLIIAISSSLALVLLISAAPAPVPQVISEQDDCVESCLKTEESCMLDSNPMLDCLDAYDRCYDVCFPEPPTEHKVSSNTQKHTDVTFEDKDTPPTPTTTENEEHKQQEEEEEEEEDFIEILAPSGGEDDDEYEDDPSDY
ncbi:hypothetical protein BG011_004889 [Mortierella polycephala]|uniref:Uncharacterized protein n=1 Tax=Mortierella polycephala TaxID=41804 RepID=A0A9P6Q0K4_9FUNG|nr:hypothetical protein BG011_004889 [Mortierella polycephala]